MLALERVYFQEICTGMEQTGQVLIFQKIRLARLRGWRPFEDEIAFKSENLILKYNKAWTGCGDTVHPVWVPDEYSEFFNIEKQEEFRVDIPFTRDSWHGRMRACRGTAASMWRN